MKGDPAMFLISGGTGNVGSQVVKQLASMGYPTRVLARNPERARSLEASNVEIVAGDFDAPASLDRAFAGVTKAFLLSPIVLNQVEQQRNFIRAAQRAGVQHLVKSSIIDPAPDSPCGYMAWHAQTEQELAESGLAYTNIRPHLFMQQVLEMAGLIANQGVMYGPFDNDAKVSAVDVRDIAAVVVGVLTTPGHEGQTYTVTGPNVLSFDEMAAKISVGAGHPVAYVHFPSKEMAYGALGQLGLPEWRIADLLAMADLFNTGAYAYTTDVVARVGQKTPIGYDQFVEDHAAVFRGEVAAPLV